MHLGEGLNPGLLALSRLLSWAEPNEWVIQDSVRRAVAMRGDLMRGERGRGDGRGAQALLFLTLALKARSLEYAAQGR